MAQLEEIIERILWSTGTDAFQSEDEQTIFITEDEEQIVGSWDQTNTGSVFFLIPTWDGGKVKVSFTGAQVERIEAEMEEDPEVDLSEVKGLSRKIEALKEAIETAQEVIADAKAEQEADLADELMGEVHERAETQKREMSEEVRRVQATFKSLGTPIKVTSFDPFVCDLEGEGLEVVVSRDYETLEFATYVRRGSSEPTLLDGDVPAPTSTAEVETTAQEVAPVAASPDPQTTLKERGWQFMKHFRSLGYDAAMEQTAVFLSHQEWTYDSGLFDAEVRHAGIQLSIDAPNFERLFFAWDALPTAAQVKEFYEGEWHRESVRLMDEIAIPRHWLWQLESIACSIRNPHDTAEHRLLYTAIAQLKAHAEKLEIHDPLYATSVEAISIANRLLAGDLEAREDLANLLFDEMTTLKQAWWHIDQIDKRLGINLPQYA